MIGIGPAAGPYTHYTSRRKPLLGPKPPGGTHLLVRPSVEMRTLECLERIEGLLQRLVELKEPEKRQNMQVSKSDRKGR